MTHETTQVNVTEEAAKAIRAAVFAKYGKLRGALQTEASQAMLDRAKVIEASLRENGLRG